MNPSSDQVRDWLLAHRGEVNTLVRDRSAPGLAREAGVEAGLKWMEALWRSTGTLELYPLELALDLAGRGLLKNPASLENPVAEWMGYFPRALGTAGKDLMISWIHLLLKLETYPPVREKLEKWLSLIPCGDLEGEVVLRFLAACTWLGGLPLWRRAGLEALAALPENTAHRLRTLAAGDRPPGFWSDLTRHPLGLEPWARTAGGALGFTGAWEASPAVELRGGVVVVRQGGKAWEVAADFFGAQLVPALIPEASPGQPPAQEARKGWKVQGQVLRSPSGKDYPFPFGTPPELRGVEREDGLAVVGSPDFLSLLLLYRGPS